MSARAGWHIRESRALENAAAKLCECKHRIGDHREFRSTWAVVDGVPVEVRHPEYEPGLFKCDHCECRRRGAAR